MNEKTMTDIRHDRAATTRPDITISIDKVRGVLEALRFGSITLTVHDARVVQIDVTEKTRLHA
jgi:hypothetical protein